MPQMATAKEAAAERAAAERAAAKRVAAERAAAERAAAEKAAAEKAAAEKAKAEARHWRMELDKMGNARAGLCEAQDRMRLLAAAVAANDDESLRDATKMRDEARVALVRVLEEALHVHNEGEERRRSLTAEVAALQQKQQGECGLTLAEQVWLERLHNHVLPMLEIGTVREEREDLLRHAERPSTVELHTLHKAWIAATDDLDDRQTEERRAKRHASAAEEAIQATHQARSAVQRAERALHAERMRLAQVAAAHFPELFAMEPLLKLGAAEGVDSDELRRVLVERELSHYNDMKLISATDGRHKVWRASYAGDQAEAELCVLKEYNLSNASEWKALLKEVNLLGQLSKCLMTSLMTSLITDDLPHQVNLLGQLSECLFIATVDAIFVVNAQDSYAAYVQLPYYNGGDMLR